MKSDIIYKIGLEEFKKKYVYPAIKSGKIDWDYRTRWGTLAFREKCMEIVLEEDTKEPVTSGFNFETVSLINEANRVFPKDSIGENSLNVIEQTKDHIILKFVSSDHDTIDSHSCYYVYNIPNNQQDITINFDVKINGFKTSSTGSFRITSFWGEMDDEDLCYIPITESPIEEKGTYVLKNDPNSKFSIQFNIFGPYEEGTVEIKFSN